MTYVVRQYEGHCMWEGTPPARAKDTEFATLQEALAYRAPLTKSLWISYPGTETISI